MHTKIQTNQSAMLMKRKSCIYKNFSHDFRAIIITLWFTITRHSKSVADKLEQLIAPTKCSQQFPRSAYYNW